MMANGRAQMEEDLSIFPWFSGVLSREKAELLLSTADEGTFLVRESAANPGSFTITVRIPDGIKHIFIRMNGRLFHVVKGVEEKTLPELVATALRVSRKKGLILDGQSITLKDPFQGVRKSSMEGEWVCPTCGCQNLGQRPTCHKCLRPAHINGVSKAGNDVYKPDQTYKCPLCHDYDDKPFANLVDVSNHLMHECRKRDGTDSTQCNKSDSTYYYCSTYISIYYTYIYIY
eukprot:m.57088 g.57088  ORF g.57088 m.57088 type:complete len:231 (-) comp11079_c0_seq1:7-699(-)